MPQNTAAPPSLLLTQSFGKEPVSPSWFSAHTARWPRAMQFFCLMQLRTRRSCLALALRGASGVEQGERIEAWEYAVM